MNQHENKIGMIPRPDSKVHGANMRPTWVLSAPDGPHVGPMNLDIWADYHDSMLSQKMQA